MRQVIVFGLLFFSAASLRAQVAVSIDSMKKYGRYDEDRLPPAFHRDRRDVLRANMPQKTAALFMSAARKNRANDVDYEYHQDPNFYYLTGHLDPDAALLLLKEPIVLDGISTHEVLFVQPRDPHIEVWTGRRPGPEGARAILGFESAQPITHLDSILDHVLPHVDSLYYSYNYDNQLHEPALDTVYRLFETTRAAFARRYPNLKLSSLRSTLAKMRMVKTDEELRLLREAIRITNMAHNEILRNVQPGWHEYEIQALGEYVFTKNGSEYTGYPCIVGSGENSVILHYNTNRRKTQAGDVVEMDIGAEYHGYTADVTRSYPVNGKFTKEQRIIYDLVLEAQDSGIAACQIDSSFRAPHNAAVSVITRGLKQLGLIKEDKEYRKYFMHGTSHYLGLDVHDPGTYGKLVDRTVLTVEPGIYIKEGSECDPKWWNIGIRIEDDILVTPEGPVNLSIASPRTADEVERMMAED